MVQKKTISIIVPVYNVKPYLDECVRSVVQQTYRDIEIILVDDGSVDDSSAICDEWANKDSRVKVLHNKNQGLSAARNAGIDIACGEYIYFVDSDDYIKRELCAEAMRFFEETGADIVAFNFYEVHEDGTLSIPRHNHCGGMLTAYEALSQLVHDNLRTHAWSKVYKRELFANIRFPVGYHCEDIGTIYKLFMSANTIYVLDDKLYYYRQRQGSIMNEWSNKTMFDLYKMKRMRCEDLALIYPDLAEVDFRNVAFLAKNVYIRSLYTDLEKIFCDDIVDFLTVNKTKILSEIQDKDFVFYYRYPKIYSLYWVFRHWLGRKIKKIAKKRK